jgi:hypothetical protein
MSKLKRIKSTRNTSACVKMAGPLVKLVAKIELHCLHFGPKVVQSSMFKLFWQY